jgi:hypothetical protein
MHHNTEQVSFWWAISPQHRINPAPWNDSLSPKSGKLISILNNSVFNKQRVKSIFRLLKRPQLRPPTLYLQPHSISQIPQTTPASSSHSPVWNLINLRPKLSWSTAQDLPPIPPLAVTNNNQSPSLPAMSRMKLATTVLRPTTSPPSTVPSMPT